MIQTLEDLSLFLHRWYGEDSGALSEQELDFNTSVPASLTKSWHLFGQLFVGNADWFRSGTPSPLACQDAFAAPANMKAVKDIIMVATENQGNWVAGYKAEDSHLDDPEIWSSWMNVWENTGQDYIRIGARLSEFIITISLTETVFFSLDSFDANDDISQQCDVILWEGRYYNAVGIGDRYTKPSHRIRSNASQTLLCFDSDGEFSNFAGSAMIARENWAALKTGDGET